MCIGYGINFGQPCGNCRIIRTGELEYLDRQMEAGCQCCIAMLFYFGNHPGIIGRINNNSNMLKILCSSPEHGGAADVDIFNGMGHCAVRIPGGLVKGIEIYRDKIYLLQTMGRYLFFVGCISPNIQNAAMHFGM